MSWLPAQQLRRCCRVRRGVRSCFSPMLSNHRTVRCDHVLRRLDLHRRRGDRGHQCQPFGAQRRSAAQEQLPVKMVTVAPSARWFRAAVATRTRSSAPGRRSLAKCGTRGDQFGGDVRGCRCFRQTPPRGRHCLEVVPHDHGPGARVGVHDAHTVLLGNGLFDRDRAPGIATDPVDLTRMRPAASVFSGSWRGARWSWSCGR